MKRGIQFSSAFVRQHQARHGFAGDTPGTPDTPKPPDTPADRMNKTESAYALILEAMKRKGEIIRYQFEGISLPWGFDPKTGKPMWYTPDFFVIKNAFRQHIYLSDILLIEVKGPHIREKDWIRFKGCRSDWPELSFELHQRKTGQWERVA